MLETTENKKNCNSYNLNSLNKQMYFILKYSIVNIFALKVRQSVQIHFEPERNCNSE